MQMQPRSDRDLRLPMWVAAGTFVLLVALVLVSHAGCGPEYLRPVVALCEPACDKGHSICVTAADGIDELFARQSALIGCNTGLSICDLGCQWLLAQETAPSGAYGSSGAEDPCAEFYRGCIEQGDPDVCSAAADACRAELTP